MTTFGTDVDQTVEAITTTYDAFGRVEFVASFDNYTSGTPRDEVQLAYTDLWEIQHVWQEPDGEVDGSTLEVSYAYETFDMDEGNYSRLTTMTYPDGSELAYDYGSDTDDSISRLRALALDATPVTIATYDYLGLGAVVVMDLSLPKTPSVSFATRDVAGGHHDLGDSQPTIGLRHRQHQRSIPSA